tara:strand:- start:435 stop:1856 length:1422 start_codon:yes stop_codon:yes gene_type:complete
MIKLNKINLPLIKNVDTFPNYNIIKKNKYIIHFGVGKFHRAHQAFFIHEILNLNNDYALIGVNIRTRNIIDILKKQDYLYTLIEHSDNKRKIHIINSISEILFGIDNKESIRQHICNSKNKVVTLTVTEKGYHYNNVTNSLDKTKEIIEDFKDNNLSTVIAHLSYGLIERFKKTNETIHILSCDNMPNNGNILKKVIKDFIFEINNESNYWFDEKVFFPNTMVDCIVPNTRSIPEGINLNYIDESVVICEPYRDWYIESNNLYLKSIFKHPRIKFVDDVSFYEDVKLKILNASHSAIAYLGLLLDYTYVHEAILDKKINYFISEYLDQEVIPTLKIRDDFDILKYKNSIIERFKNSFLNHRLDQIATDGSLKIPIRIINTYLKKTKNKDYSFTETIIAAWIFFLKSRTLTGKKIEVNDTNLNILQDYLYLDKNKMIHGILSIKKIFNIDEITKNSLIRNIIKKYKNLEKGNIF